MYVGEDGTVTKITIVFNKKNCVTFYSKNIKRT